MVVQVTPVDDVILGTGYQIKFPFLPKDVVSVVDNHVQLYNLAIVGLVQPIGAIFPVSEMQSRWVAEVLSRRCSLPSTKDMHEDIERKQEAMRLRYVASPRHTIQYRLEGPLPVARRATGDHRLAPQGFSKGQAQATFLYAFAFMFVLMAAYLFA
ncbi:hypothetical protein HPB48_019067 [Haemaphysalis longicornis]|uniref:Flavin-containing monooxygenase n=1 Tax=Haemaphysalis longicornis TaxID=44386 RepID=A0A9J6GY21_HAELO|nr:hypothetical protein HPB48_019067 [Haemaphysalis longicornis]